ncbi:LamG-like jellyroll fold domain-containing protein [Mangrovimonas spongiae]|uniref:Choice-of-anchor D domain-containing protein n=1 Tax=Mangrovimonas spongiae TaxID=2494697 RepID=A0A428K1Z7_9FLAO|nr:LamG-like jellyroll fold domain-containing protein [Mangrovimonas spongiae]RSK40438.1 choice-of-anchor D domain-containing protein [Mangrovimonas spongiae]
MKTITFLIKRVCFILAVLCVTLTYSQQIGVSHVTNQVTISDNSSNSPSTANNTDFGNANSMTFYIGNIQNGNPPILTISSIDLSNPDFIISSGLNDNTIDKNQTEPFTITYIGGCGTATSTVTITHDGTNDSDAPTNQWVFTISANSSPEINILGNATTITSGDTTPSTIDNTIFPTTDAGFSSTPFIYTIENNGSCNLDISSITLSNTTNFTLTDSTPETLTPGSSTTFSIIFNPTANGTTTSVVTVNNTDSNETPYTFTVQGEGIAPLTEGPGGVVNNLQLWLKGNAGLSYTDGQPVSLWADQGRGADASAPVSSVRPTYRDNPSRNVNFNPVVEFDNVYESFSKDTDFSYDDPDTEFLYGSSGLYTQDMFVVLIPDDTEVNSSFGFMDTFCGDADVGTNETDATGIGMGDFTGRVDGESICFALGTYNESESGDGYAVYDQNTSYDNVGIINARNNIAVTQQELYYNANNIEYGQNDIAEFLNVEDSRYWIGRSEGWEATLNARVVEIITYSSRKNDTDLTQERNKIQSYLAVKYGITLGINGTSQDYVDSDGTLIWDVNTGTPTEDVFNYDIAGIGRDDASNLLQKQSRSVNNATDGDGKTQGVLTMGISSIQNTNNLNTNTQLTDKQFLMWGNDGANLNDPAVVVDVDMSTNISPSLSTDVQFNGIARTWKVVEKGGDIPTVEVQMLTSAIRTATPPDGRYLMFISDTPNFDPTADYRVMTETTNELGEAVVTTNYDFDGTKYITFGWAPERRFVRSIYFDPTEQNYIDMEDALNLNSSEFTVSAWIKRDTNSEDTSILSKRDASYTNGYDLKINNNGYAEMSWGNSGTQTITSNVIIPENQWHHIAVIYSSGNATMYIDGVESASQSLSAPSNTNHSFYIGAAAKNTPEAFFHGNIDEVRVWDVALSLDELHFIMNQEILENSSFVEGAYFESRSITPTKNDVNTLPWNSLAGYYPMSTYTYTNTKDESGNGHQGALRHLRTVDRQTAPLPYQSTANGDWDTATTWTNGTVQTMPGANSIVDNSITVDWNIVETNHNVTMDNSSLASGNNGNRNVLALMVDSNELTVNGDNTNETGFGITISHYLNLDGKIDLEGESQLIQTLNSDLVVGATGNLEKDQQGTRDLFTYNYWSSPVGVTATANPNNYSYSLNSNILKDGTNSASPTNINFVGGYNGSSSSPVSIASYWLWKFGNLPSGDYSSWQHVRHTGTILAGEGFTMKGVTNTNSNVSLEQNYVFDGKPNNGDVNLTLNSGNDYLVGNPYPSAIDAEQFILDNGPTLDYTGSAPEGDPLISGTLYFWEHWGGGSHVLAEYQGGYGTYNLAGGVPAAAWGTPDPDVAQVGTGTKTPGRYIPVGQGFFVTGDSTGDINFNNGQRVFQKEGTSASVFMRNDGSNQQQATAVDNRMKLRIGFNSVNTIHRQLLVTVDVRASQGFDWGFDGLTNEDQMDDMYWMLDNNKYTVQGIDTINESTILPLGIHTDDNGLNNITIDILENVPDHLDIYAHDKELGIYHNLRESRYEFYLDAGEYLDRFEITFASQSLSTDDNFSNTNNLQVHYSNNSQSIVIHNPKLAGVESVEMTTILGQKLFTFNNVETATLTTIKTKQLSTGTYIIQVNTKDNATITKKVLVNN